MIIEVDDFKKQIPGYDPKRSEDFHSRSGKLADKAFMKALKDPAYKTVILMAGGTASGKTEFAKTRLDNDNQLVYDGTLRNYNGFDIKSRNVKRYAKNDPVLKVVYIVPENWIRAFEVFLERDRKMYNETFFETHRESALTIAKILRDTDAKVEIYISRLKQKDKKMEYVRWRVDSREKVASSLEKLAKFFKNTYLDYRT